MLTVEAIRLPALVTRRTRNNVKQSKNGCFSCRAQRKKCDEGKPSCLRCVRSGKICESFTHDASPLSALKSQQFSPLCRVPSTHLQTDHTQSRFAALGFEVLAQQACRDAFGIVADVWTCLLPQLSSANLTVYASIASLGAAYEAVVLRPVHQLALGDSLAAVQYHKALASLRSDILMQDHGPIPSFLASVLLAAVEVLFRRLINALMHLHGAFSILKEYIYRSAQFQSAPSVDQRPDESKHRVKKDDSQDLHLIAQALDIQTATYALSRVPELPPSSFTSTHSSLGTLSNSSISPKHANSRLIPLLHACYHFTSLASRYKYVPRSEIPSHITLDQNRYLALLSQWLPELDHHTSTPIEQNLAGGQSASSTSARCPLLVLRIQCISAIIYLSTILSHKERAYDSLTSLFQQIVDGANILLNNHLPTGCLSSHQNRFRLISPLSQPLYLTAMKCRHGVIRRKAIDLLSLTGREGPWYGAIHVKVAQRAVEIEEERVRLTGDLPLDPDMKDADTAVVVVTEKSRLHGCGIDSDPTRLHGGGLIRAHFSRCVDTEHMMTRSDVPWDSRENWEMWTERFAV